MIELLAISTVVIILHYINVLNKHILHLNLHDVICQFSSVAQSCPTLCDPMNCSMPGSSVLYYHLKYAQIHVHWPGDSVVKILLQYRRHRFDPWIRKILWRRKWQLTPVFLPGKSHRQRSLAGTVHGVTKELDRTSWLNNNIGFTSLYSRNKHIIKQLYPN